MVMEVGLRFAMREVLKLWKLIYSLRSQGGKTVGAGKITKVWGTTADKSIIPTIDAVV